MGALAILAQLLTLSNTLTPLIAGLVAQIKGDNPGMTDDQIIAQAQALAAETKQITTADKSSTP
jgi:hypothetical protein